MRDPREQFGPAAEKYLVSPVHANEADLAHCVSMADPKGGPVLDVGTGAGHTAFAFAPFASKVIASDVTPEMLDVVACVASERGLRNVETLLAPAECIPAEDGAFEGVACRVAAHHFQDVPAFLSEAFRILHPGGWLLIVDTVGIEHPLADEQLDKIEFQRDPSHIRNYTLPAWLSMVRSAGFDVEKHEVATIPHNVNHWLDRMSVEEPIRSRVIESIVESQDWLREYLRPHGEGETLTFRLHQMKLLARKLT